MKRKKRNSKRTLPTRSYIFKTSWKEEKKPQNLLDIEPTWALRAKDQLAPLTILRWAADAEASGVNVGKVTAAITDAMNMVRWQRRNGCKIPD